MKERPTARYMPRLSDAAIGKMELRCITRKDRQELHTAQPTIRVFWQKMQHFIGASLGEETQFIRVQVGQDGVYHGRPVTATELKEEGVPWNQLN